LNGSVLFAEKRLYYFHVLICSLGLLGLLLFLGNMFGQIAFHRLNANIMYLPWSQMVLQQGKLVTLAQYGFGLVGLFVYYFIFLFFLNDSCFCFPFEKNEKNYRMALYLYFILLFAINIAIWMFSKKLTVVFGAFGVGFFAVPFLFLPLKRAWQKEWKIASGLGVVVLGFFVLQLFVQFYPYIFQEIRVANDFMDIPEITIMKDGAMVDNTQYINATHLGGLTKYDPRLTYQQNVTHFPTSKLLEINSNSTITAYIKNHIETYGYLGGSSVLIAIDQDSTISDYKDFLGLLSPADQIKAKTYIVNTVGGALHFSGYSAYQQEFIHKNQQEMYNTALAGHYFHHQSAMLAPIHEYHLGRPEAQIGFLYGWFNAVAINKLTSFLGGLNFQNYTKVLFSFYPLYFFLFILVGYVIFRDVWTTVLVALLGIGGMELYGFEAIRYASGFNPLRHFFDLIVLLGFYGYLKLEKNKTLGLVGIFTLSLISAVFSREFGLFLFLSLWASVFLFEFVKAERKALIGTILLVFVLLLGLVLHITPTGGKDSQLVYLLLGVAVPLTSKFILLFFLVGVALNYYFLLTFCKKATVENKLTWFLFFYIQAFALYFIWCFDLGHLFCMSAILSLFAVLMLRQLLSIIKTSNQQYRFIVYSLSIVVSVSFYIPTVAYYFIQQHRYNTIFLTHEVYDWNFKMAKFETTMDPVPFQQSVALIEKYARNQNGIYIISKYDVLLPFLANKYSLMPSQGLVTSLITQREISQTRNLILKANPKYIFVDSDINWPLLSNIYGKDDLITNFVNNIYFLSLGRAMVLDSLTQLFQQVSVDYTPVAWGGLVTVYERNTDILQNNTHQGQG
jgi:hypothetical protein